MKVAVIGGGAAGFFAAINTKINYPDSEVVLLEKTTKLLSKVKVSGGGRCNVTNGCKNIKILSAGYPRGEELLKKAFKIFDNKATWKWFESRGVPLKTEDDGRVFPQSNESQSIIDCLMLEMKQLGIDILTKKSVTSIQSQNDQLHLEVKGDTIKTEIYDKVIIATGGSPKREGLKWLEELGHNILDPVPSLFTFNMPSEPVKELMGVVAPNATVSIQTTKLKASGPLLITHWGMSGPAILKLSSFGARALYEMGYNFVVQVNWVGIINQDQIAATLYDIVKSNPKKQISNIKPFELPERLWLFLLKKMELPLDKVWGELGKKGVHKIVRVLANDSYNVKGKTTFKEEFVTCGGVSLNSINHHTMQSTACPNLYFAGEVLDIDGITGGYNFQAAWTTAFKASKLGN